MRFIGTDGREAGFRQTAPFSCHQVLALERLHAFPSVRLEMWTNLLPVNHRAPDLHREGDRNRLLNLVQALLRLLAWVPLLLFAP
jgi:hypothetical protein